MAKKKKPSQTKKNSAPLQISDEAALHYHEYSSSNENHRLPGKIEVVPTKSTRTQRDLSLAYTPGVAAACEAIYKDPATVSDYTARANLVAVVSNGTAVLGLGNIGPFAAKPVMEGKAVLFKRFANVDVFDIELNAPTAAEVIQTCKALEPTVGGINLEDIKAPECFEIEEELKKTLKIPVFHDDQHGTAIIVTAALYNALHLTKRKAKDTKIVFSGAGAAAIACANLIQKLGIQKKNILMCDKEGVIRSDRSNLDPFKQHYAQKTKLKSLGDALQNADVFIGLSVGGTVTGNMVKKMGKKPIIFALANPTPEISYDEAKSARPDALVATGRSDYPNQINNVLGFPYIFRGALDVVSSKINDEMKMAAAKALANLAREDVPESVAKAYGGSFFKFGPDYIIPKPFDSRALYWVAPAVAEAAIKTKVAQKKINIEEYQEDLKRRIDPSRQILSSIYSKAKRELKKLVFPEGDEVKIIKAACILRDEHLAEPVLLGNPKGILQKAKEHSLHLEGIEILEPSKHTKRNQFSRDFLELRQRRGMSVEEADKLLLRRTYFGMMMVRSKMADGLVCGLTKSYPETIKPALQIIKMKPEFKHAAGLYMVIVRERVLFFADTTVNIDPSAECLAEITIQTARRVRLFDITPRIALVSFSNFGSVNHPINDKIYKAIELVKAQEPNLIIDGEMQADTAITKDLLQDFPFSNLKESANVLIFPNLAAGNIAYKLLQRLANAEVIGPILMGLKQPVHILQRASSVQEIVNMATIAAAEANENQTEKKK